MRRRTDRHFAFADAGPSKWATTTHRARRGEVAYRMSERGDNFGGCVETRAGVRQRTRLRSGKIVDLQGNFITECIVHDRSPMGARIRSTANIPIPDRIQLYDDEQGTLAMARIVWRRQGDLGVRILAQKQGAAISKSILVALGAKYYAVGK